jgi:hypothetical protein
MPDAFWKNAEYARESYTDEAPTPQQVADVERRLGYRLPRAYVELTKTRNGGVPLRTCHRASTRTTWAEDHIAITGIFSIGDRKAYSLCGGSGSQFWIDEWGYPPIGVYFADCPSAGHDMVCLDYRACGPQGEPQVVHVDQERDYAVTLVAESFEAFINGLESAKAFGD